MNNNNNNLISLNDLIINLDKLQILINIIGWEIFYRISVKLIDKYKNILFKNNSNKMISYLAASYLQSMIHSIYATYRGNYI